eukprot:CAMPEP_0168302640 /NCGR_PEP_ID=MMETSP0142_2-20121227/40044_1 /TAXON_ID=44445 /ORGANISM="Pseudo-nitzschia australis, Strain 10249 10 AB" /LENGTH=74 /DNA_ID=CAMNT_0008253317 /DNA_START=1 /DNA_END=222 /DNA_ORIENTATION=-
MVPITIYLNSIFREEDALHQDNTFADADPRDPLMILDCEGSNVLILTINAVMVNKAETVKVADGASCSMMVKNV